MGFTLGQAKSETIAGGGRIRANVVDNRNRARMTQKMQRQLERRQHGGVTSLKSKISGTMSSVSFTPIQVSLVFVQLMLNRPYLGRGSD